MCMMYHILELYQLATRSPDDVPLTACMYVELYIVQVRTL